MRDIRSPRLLVIKACLFLVLGMIAAALLLSDAPTFRDAALLIILIWAFSRAYYFAFYVIERYIDPGYRFSGLLSAARFLMARSRR